jgi:hypothetical protein
MLWLFTLMTPVVINGIVFEQISRYIPSPGSLGWEMMCVCVDIYCIIYIYPYGN